MGVGVVYPVLFQRAGEEVLSHSLPHGMPDEVEGVGFGFAQHAGYLLRLSRPELARGRRRLGYMWFHLRPDLREDVGFEHLADNAEPGVSQALDDVVDEGIFGRVGLAVEVGHLGYWPGIFLWSTIWHGGGSCRPHGE